jgi:3-oxoacyl-[acyl-carrier protein] reductase
MSAGPITLSLEGRAALITGAATGIGRACALAFAQAGAHVVVNHCGQESLAHALVAELRDRDLQAWAVDADVSSSSAIQAIQAQVQSFAPPIDILLNNAGIIAEKPFLETTEAEWDRMIDVDLKSVFLMCRAFLPAMVARSRGVVINIASDLGYLGRAGFAPYCAAKAGVMGLTRSLAREFAHNNIRVNAIAPGPVATGMLSLESMRPETLALERNIPQHRFAEPHEIAATALFLAGDASHFYCGQVLGPNGGSVMP